MYYLVTSTSIGISISIYELTVLAALVEDNLIYHDIDIIKVHYITLVLVLVLVLVLADSIGISISISINIGIGFSISIRLVLVLVLVLDWY